MAKSGIVLRVGVYPNARPYPAPVDSAFLQPMPSSVSWTWSSS